MVLCLDGSVFRWFCVCRGGKAPLVPFIPSFDEIEK
jgi:hypothetical protein